MKILKFLFFGIIILAVLGFIAVKGFSKEKPEGKGGEEADQLAEKVLKALNKEAFDTISYLKFDFFGGKNKYFWDKKNEKAIIEWGDKKVIMDLKSLEPLCFVEGQKVEGAQANKLKESAWSKWCNDSFWMIAPFKVFDEGTTRKIVALEESEGEVGLLIEYESGGVTPGDSYLWILDKKYRPTGYKMWTQILPVKGLYASWEDWQEFDGAYLSLMHKFPGKEMRMENVKSGSHWSEFGYKSDPFNI